MVTFKFDLDGDNPVEIAEIMVHLSLTFTFFQWIDCQRPLNLKLQLYLLEYIVFCIFSILCINSLALNIQDVLLLYIFNTI